MGMHRRELRVLDPCSVFDPADRVALCSHCNKDVHDLSRMTQRDARRLLDASKGKAICVAYTSRRDGTVVFRPAASMAGWLSVCLLLSACTGWTASEEINLPGDVCFDASGQEVDCMDPAAGYEVVPSALDDASAPPQREFEPPGRRRGCPVPYEYDGPIEVASKVVEVVNAKPAEVGGSGGVHMRVDFSIDLEASRRFVGIIVPNYDSVDRNGPYGRLKYEPTDELWSDLAERVRERKAQRRARRRDR